MASPQAEPAAVNVFAFAALETCISAPAAQLPELRYFSPVEVCLEQMALPGVCEQWMASPAAEPVAVNVFASSALETCSIAPAATLPGLPYFAIGDPWMSESTRPRPLQVSTAPVSAKYASPAATAADMAPAAASLPKFEVAPVEVCLEQMAVPDVCGRCMPSPAAEPVAVNVFASSAAETFSAPAIRLPGMRHLAIADPWMPMSLRLRPSLDAEPVSMKVWPQAAMAALPVYGELPAPLVLDARHLQPASDAPHATPMAAAVPGLAPELVETMVLPACDPAIVEGRTRVLCMPAFVLQDMRPAACLAGAMAALEAEPVETMPACSASQPVPLTAVPELRLPFLPVGHAEDLGVAGLKGMAAMGVSPAAPTTTTHPIAAEPLRTLFVVPPQPRETEQPVAAISAHGFVPLDFFSQRPAATPSRKMVWCTPANQPILPGLALHPIFERLEDAVPQKRTKKAPAIAEIFEHPEAAKKKAHNAMVGHLIKAIAACLLLGSVVWFGVGTIRIGNQTPAVNRDASMSDTASSIQSEASSPSVSSPITGRPAATSQPHGAIAKIRQAISDRAAATVTDSFHNGMQAWGSASKQWAPGWSHHPDGYVQVGQLALFRPSQNFKDYHMEFFGQIESRGMGWAVRAHDTQNYYAMKLAVIEPGLRPVIAMEHYPVVGGKKGRPVQIPLSVMVHNNRPMQVEVDVQGNKLLTSVDGQLVDTWIDDTLVAGGVGFFSEAGERARLYWMRISKNEDFLGRICAYVANTLGDGTRSTAELWPQQAPRTPQPQPVPERTQEAALAATAAGLSNGLTSNRRRDKWNS